MKWRAGANTTRRDRGDKPQRRGTIGAAYGVRCHHHTSVRARRRCGGFGGRPLAPTTCRVLDGGRHPPPWRQPDWDGTAASMAAI